MFFGAANHFSVGFAAGSIAIQVIGCEAGFGLRILRSDADGIALGLLCGD